MAKRCHAAPCSRLQPAATSMQKLTSFVHVRSINHRSTFTFSSSMHTHLTSLCCALIMVAQTLSCRRCSLRSSLFYLQGSRAHAGACQESCEESTCLSDIIAGAQGYNFTGDGARRDEDGFIWITGRVDDVINVSGHRVGTAEVESALATHPACTEAAVVGCVPAACTVHSCTA